jgi:hypothetical protein
MNSDLVSLLALLVSVGSFALSLQTKRQAKNVGLLSTRQQAIHHVQNALHDVLLHGIVTSETKTSILDAYHIASVAFSEDIKQALDDAHKLAFLCHGAKFDRETEKDWDNEDQLKKRLNEIYNNMVKEAKT